VDRPDAQSRHPRARLLEAFGDLERVEVGIDRLARVGSGATSQRRTFAKTGQLLDVVVEAVRRTAAN
jgi:hypothetical protein